MASGHWIPELVRIARGQDNLAHEGMNSRRIDWDQVKNYSPKLFDNSSMRFVSGRFAFEKFRQLRNSE